MELWETGALESPGVYNLENKTKQTFQALFKIDQNRTAINKKYPTWSEVMTPLAATVNFIHSDACQKTHVVSFLQFGHQQLAFGNFLWGNVQQLEGAVFIYHTCQDPLGVLLQMKIDICALHSTSHMFKAHALHPMIVYLRYRCCIIIPLYWRHSE